MNFRNAWLLTVSLLIASTVKAQTIESCVTLLNSKATEIAGQIKILNGNRFIVRDASFSFKNGLANILWDSDKKNRSTVEFYPGEIEKIEVPKSDITSPIGTIVIYFTDPVVKSLNLVTETAKYQRKAYFNFIQKDPKNAELIKNTLLQLKKLCIEKFPSTALWNSLAFLTSDQSIWTSKKSVSYTYKIKKVDYSGCNIRFSYNLEIVSLTSTLTANYLAVIPINNIGKIVYDTKNSKPASFWMEGDDEFEIFKQNASDEEYLFYGKQDRIPLAVTDSEKGEAALQSAIEAALKDASKCGHSRSFKFTRE